MSNLKQLEHDALNLPPREREHLVMAMWDSLDGAPAVDPEGVEQALARDATIASGTVEPIDHVEFSQRTRHGG